MRMHPGCCVLALPIWNDRYNPRFTKQEIEDLVSYLNRDFCKFPK